MGNLTTTIRIAYDSFLYYSDGLDQNTLASLYPTSC